MSFSIVIPARYASTRLPRKLLLDLDGKPVLQHVWERARQSAATRVTIAADHPEIAAACRGFGAEVVMTRQDHQSGTDRLQEAAQLLEMAEDAILVNVQGDEPLIPPAVINQVADNLANNPAAAIATLSEPIVEREVLDDPDAVKVVTSASGRALYFSRAPIPWDRDGRGRNADGLTRVSGASRHIGIYAYRVAFLRRFVEWEPAPLEQLEKLEQLRAMFHDEVIHVAHACEPVPAGVDTQSDLDALRQRLAGGA